MNNTRVVKRDYHRTLDVGWIGVDDKGDYHFKPTRGSGGFALYSTEGNCLRNSGCKRAIKISLTWAPTDPVPGVQW